MPHITIEYSANVGGLCDIDELVDVVHDAALNAPFGDFPAAGIRTRAVARDHYKIADGNPRHGFASLHAQIGPGRSLEVKRSMVELLLAAVNQVLGPVQETEPLAISAKLTEIDATLRINQNNIGDFL